MLRMDLRSVRGKRGTSTSFLTFPEERVLGFLCLLLWEGTRKRTQSTEQSFLWLGNISSDPVKSQSKSGKLEKRGPNPNSSSHTRGNKPVRCRRRSSWHGPPFPASGHLSWTSCRGTEKRELIHSRHTKGEVLGYEKDLKLRSCLERAD